MVLKWISDNIAVFQAPVNIGLVKIENNHYLIDSGIDNFIVNKIVKSIDGGVSGAFITHHHADHMGGVNKLNQMGVNDIFVPEAEIPFFNHTYLEPLSIFGGHPSKHLRNRHLESKPALNVNIFDASPVKEIKAVETAGHSLQHTSFLFEDVLFAGDAIFDSQIINKYKLLFASNPLQASNVLDMIRELDWDVMVLAHGGIHEKKEALDSINATRNHYVETSQLMLSMTDRPTKLSDLTSKLIQSLNLSEIVDQRGLTQYYLYEHTVKGYISELVDLKQLSLSIDKSEVIVQSL
jgi:glyoxylase-like metal-dependent hydrolase (beta-lactamase superfamily II)